MIEEQSLVSACSAVSTKYGEDIGQDVAVTLLEWDKRGSLKATDELSLKRIALRCGYFKTQPHSQTRMEAKTICVSFGTLGGDDHMLDHPEDANQINLDRVVVSGLMHADRHYANPLTDESITYLVGSESVAERMEFCELKRLLCDPKNAKMVRHALGEKQYSRE